MNCFVISLKRRKDRLKRFLTRAELAQVPVKVIEAIDGEKVNFKSIWLDKYDNLITRRYLKKGEIGCYLSHYKCYQMSDADRVFVFEDDAYIPLDFWYQLNIKLKTLPKDFDVALLGTTSLWRRKYSSKCKKIWENEDWARYEGDIYGLQGYIISRKAIETMLDCKYPLNVPIDVKINHLGLNLYVLKVNLIDTLRLGSDTQR